jgi:hypothetical protein
VYRSTLSANSPVIRSTFHAAIAHPIGPSASGPIGLPRAGELTRLVPVPAALDNQHQAV